MNSALLYIILSLIGGAILVFLIMSLRSKPSFQTTELLKAYPNWPRLQT
jgi:hypothetical protein